MSTCPLVKFLAAQKQLAMAYDFLLFVTTFKWERKSTALLCMLKLLHSILDCEEFSSWVLRFPTKRDVRKIVGHDIEGCLGSLDVTNH
jgi:hypothetical protein